MIHWSLVLHWDADNSLGWQWSPKLYKLEKFQVHILSYTVSYYGFQKSPYRDGKLPQHERDYTKTHYIKIIHFWFKISKISNLYLLNSNAKVPFLPRPGEKKIGNITSQLCLTAVCDTRVSICFSRPEKCLKVFFPGNLLYCRENLTTK